MIINGIRLSSEDAVRLKNSAKAAQDLENRWVRRIGDEIAGCAKKAADQISAGSDFDVPDFEKLFIEHYFEVQIKAFKISESERELFDKDIKLAVRPKSLRDIMRAYDRWRRGLFKPKKIIKRAQKIKAAYIDAVQKTWKKYSDDFRHGDVATQEEVKRKITRSAQTTEVRAQTIVRTETTRYYNQARRSYYDASQDVTHYLFMAVRDKGTTPWCSAHTINGKRGRHGLVYAKDDPLLAKETPPCHWNCRSELLPLNRFNPVHLRLIQDASIQRRAHQCTPLPVGWSKSA